MIFNQRSATGAQYSMLLRTCAVAMLLFCTAVAPADDGKKANKKQNTETKRTANKPTLTKLSGANQKAAMVFAKAHHPELAKLLETLERKSAPEFNRGIRELHNDVERLERVREKQPNRFDSELESWKTDSQIRLLSARWMLSPSEKLKAQIDKLLRKRQHEKRQKMMTEKKRLQERLKLINEQLAQKPETRQAQIDAEWQRLDRRAASLRKSREAKSKKTNTKKTEKTE